MTDTSIHVECRKDGRCGASGQVSCPHLPAEKHAGAVEAVCNFARTFTALGTEKEMEAIDLGMKEMCDHFFAALTPEGRKHMKGRLLATLSFLLAEGDLALSERIFSVMIRAVEGLTKAAGGTVTPPAAA